MPKIDLEKILIRLNSKSAHFCIVQVDHIYNYQENFINYLKLKTEYPIHRFDFYNTQKDKFVGFIHNLQKYQNSILVLDNFSNILDRFKNQKDEDEIVYRINWKRDVFIENNINVVFLLNSTKDNNLRVFPTGLPDIYSFIGGNIFKIKQVDKKQIQTKVKIKKVRNKKSGLEGLAKIQNTNYQGLDYKNLQKEIKKLEKEREEKTITESGLNLLAGYYYQAGNYEQAQELYLEILERDKKSLGEEHPEYANHLNNLALVYKSQGKYPEAEELYKQALEIDKKTIGEEHSNYATHLNNLAGTYYSQGKYPKAEELYKQALEIGKKTVGEEHPNYAIRLNNLAGVYDSQGKYPEAEELYKQAIEIGKKTIGEEHPDYAANLNNLALVYNPQGKYPEAEELYKQAIEIDKKTIGQQHPDYAIHLNNLALVYDSQGKYPEAEELYKQALEIFKSKLGESHPYTQGTQKWLDDVNSELEKITNS